MTGPVRLDRRMLIGLCVAGAVTVFLGNLLGWWWIAAVIGLLLGLLAPDRRGILVALIAGASGWALGVVWVAVQEPILPTARALSETFELGSSAAVSIVVTILVGALLATSAAWLGRALHIVVIARAANSRS
jgi:hypothetical protein